MDLVVYVRNDPVNFGDRDGRLNCRFIPRFDVEGYPTETIEVCQDDTPSQPINDAEQTQPRWDVKKYSKCAKALTAGAGQKYIPSLKATAWLLSANSLTGADLTVIGAIWFQESDFSQNPDPSGNYKVLTDGTKVLMSTDYGPLQINDKYKLNNQAWNSLYNPNNYDLKNDPWHSYLAGAQDIADHGGSSGDWLAAASYWHGRGSKDIQQYLTNVGTAQVWLDIFFGCLER